MTKPFVEQRRGREPDAHKYRIWEPARIGKAPPPRRPRVPGLGLPEVRGGGWMSRCELPFPKLFRRARRGISKLDVVALKRDVGKWTAGTQAEVMVDQDALKVVKISDEQGRLLAVAEVPEEDLELLERRDSWSTWSKYS